MRPGWQRVGALTELPDVVRELGGDPAAVAAAAGLDLAEIAERENLIPFAAACLLIKLSADATGCDHIALRIAERNDTRSLGLVGALMRNAPTLGRALLDLCENQHRYVRGGVPYLIVREGFAWAGYAIIMGTQTLSAAVLLFGQPHSPLAQPANVIGGYLVATLVTLLALTVFPGAWVAAAAGVGIAIALMSMLRITHPPAGAIPILAATSTIQGGTLLGVVLGGSIGLVGVASLHHWLPPRHEYPKRRPAKDVAAP